VYAKIKGAFQIGKIGGDCNKIYYLDWLETLPVTVNSMNIWYSEINFENRFHNDMQEGKP